MLNSSIIQSHLSGNSNWFLNAVFHPRMSPAWAQVSLPLTQTMTSMALSVCKVIQKLLAHDGCPLHPMGVIFFGDSPRRSQGRASFLWVKPWLSSPCPAALDSFMFVGMSHHSVTPAIHGSTYHLFFYTSLQSWIMSGYHNLQSGNQYL